MVRMDFHSPGTLDVTDTFLTEGILAISAFTASKFDLAFLVLTSITTKRSLLKPRSVLLRYRTCKKRTMVAMIMTTEMVNWKTTRPFRRERFVLLCSFRFFNKSTGLKRESNKAG